MRAPDAITPSISSFVNLGNENLTINVHIQFFRYSVRFDCVPGFNLNLEEHRLYLMEEEYSDTDWTVLLIVSILVGGLGVDRFMTGHIGTGVLKLITGGGCLVWWLIDLVNIATGKFRDADGRLVAKQ